MNFNTVLLCGLNKRLSRHSALISLIKWVEIEFAYESLVFLVHDVFIDLGMIGKQVIV